MAGGNSGKEVLGQVEIEVEALQARQQLDLRLGKDHPAGLVLGVGQAAEIPWGTVPCRGSHRCDISASCSQVTPSGSFAVGPTWMGLPRDIVNLPSGRDARS